MLVVEEEEDLRVDQVDQAAAEMVQLAEQIQAQQIGVVVEEDPLQLKVELVVQES
jgi:hypothetical protein